MRDSSENNPQQTSRRGDSRIAPAAIFMIGGVGGNRHERLLRKEIRPSHRRSSPCGCPSPLLNGETGNRRSIHALPKFDKQERMYHTIHKRLQAAHSHDNEEMAQNGAIWRKYNKRKPCRFSNLPCARCPGRSRELYDNEKNATECNTMQQIFKKSSAGRALTSPGTPTHPVITLKAIPYPGSTHSNCWRCRLPYEKFRAQ